MFRKKILNLSLIGLLSVDLYAMKEDDVNQIQNLTSNTQTFKYEPLYRQNLHHISVQQIHNFIETLNNENPDVESVLRESILTAPEKKPFIGFLVIADQLLDDKSSNFKNAHTKAMQYLHRHGSDYCFERLKIFHYAFNANPGRENFYILKEQLLNEINSSQPSDVMQIKLICAIFNESKAASSLSSIEFQKACLDFYARVHLHMSYFDQVFEADYLNLMQLRFSQRNRNDSYSVDLPSINLNDSTKYSLYFTLPNINKTELQKEIEKSFIDHNAAFSDSDNIQKAIKNTENQLQIAKDKIKEISSQICTDSEKKHLLETLETRSAEMNNLKISILLKEESVRNAMIKMETLKNEKGEKEEILEQLSRQNASDDMIKKQIQEYRDELEGINKQISDNHRTFVVDGEELKQYKNSKIIELKQNDISNIQNKLNIYQQNLTTKQTYQNEYDVYAKQLAELKEKRETLQIEALSPQIKKIINLVMEMHAE